MPTPVWKLGFGRVSARAEVRANAWHRDHHTTSIRLTRGGGCGLPIVTSRACANVQKGVELVQALLDEHKDLHQNVVEVIHCACSLPSPLHPRDRFGVRFLGC